MKISKILLREIDELYRPIINNLEVEHQKVLVLFSGPPSSGKSTVAKQIEKHFKAIRLENDQIRNIATKLFPIATADWKSELTYKYMSGLRDSLLNETRNGLWIIDASIDVNYKFLYDFAKKHHFIVVLLAMEIPEPLRREWIIKTGDRAFATTERYLEVMDIRKKQHDTFLLNHTPDMFLGTDYRIEDVFDLISTKLS